MASVEERPSSDPQAPPSWRVYWRIGGRGGPKQSCTFPTAKQAESARSLTEARGHQVTRDEVYAAVLGLSLDGGGDTPPAVNEWATQWLTDREELGDIQPDTLIDYRRRIMRYILPQLGTLPISAITRETVTAWVKWLRKQPSRRGGVLEAQTVRHIHGILHQLLGAAVPKWLQSNPAAKPQGARKNRNLPKVVRHEAIFLTPVEMDLIQKACDKHIHDLVYVALRTGLRLGELLALRVEDVTVTGKRKVIRVRQALKRDRSIGAPKSRRSRRDVSISNRVAEVIAPRIEGKRGDALVFPAPKGGMWHPRNLHERHWQPAVASAMRCAEHPPPLPPKPKSGPRRKWRPDEVSTCDCATRLHRRPRIHDLRHTHVSLCVEDGWEITHVSRRVGHESISTTADLYGHLWEGETDDQRLNSLERLMMVEDDEAA